MHKIHMSIQLEVYIMQQTVEYITYMLMADILDLRDWLIDEFENLVYKSAGQLVILIHCFLQSNKVYDESKI